MIQYRYLCRTFERKCHFDDVFSLFEVARVNVKYVSRATQSRFFVNYVTNTNQIDKNRMQYQGPDNDRAKHVSNLVLCENKSNLHQQNPQWWCFLCPLPPFCFAQKIHCIWSVSYSVLIKHDKVLIYKSVCSNSKTILALTRKPVFGGFKDQPVQSDHCLYYSLIGKCIYTCYKRNFLASLCS